jgi:hypothetical protein
MYLRGESSSVMRKLQENEIKQIVKLIRKIVVASSNNCPASDTLNEYNT